MITLPPALAQRLTQGLTRGLTVWQAQPYRVRVGVVVVGFLLILYGLLVLGDGLAVAQGALQDRYDRLSRLEAMREQTGWEDRQQAYARLRDQLEERLWRGETEGLARAAFQDWVTATAQDSGLTNLRIRVGEGEPAGTEALPLRQLEIEVTSSFTPDSLFSFLDQLSQAEDLVIVRSATIRTRPVHRLEVRLVTFYREG